MRMKKIKILYFEGCPNHRATVDLVGQVVRDLGIDAEIEEIEVRDPEEATRLRFLGSPTVRVDGADIEPAARSSRAYAMACRRYGEAGVPPRSLLAAALASGNPGGPAGSSGSASSEGWGGIAIVAAGGSALLASACCIGPLVLGALGLSAAAFSAVLHPARPYLLGLTAILLAAGFYRSYFQAPAGAGGEQCHTGAVRTSRLGRSLLWLGVLVVIAISFFPTYGGSLLPAGQHELTTRGAAPSRSVVLEIEGMTCELCARHIEKELLAIAGVERAEVQYARGRARVDLSPGAAVSAEELAKAVEKAGYKGRPEGGS